MPSFLCFALAASINALCSLAGVNGVVDLISMLSGLDTLGFEVSVSGFKLAPQRATLQLPELVPVIRCVEELI
jgi:hypothetical protein